MTGNSTLSSLRNTKCFIPLGFFPQRKVGQEIMCSGARPIPWLHLQHCMRMAQQSLARQPPIVSLC